MNFVEACKEIEVNGGIFENEMKTKLFTDWAKRYVIISLPGEGGLGSNKIFNSKIIINYCQGNFHRVVD